jgi:hypothetical protein
MIRKQEKISLMWQRKRVGIRVYREEYCVAIIAGKEAISPVLSLRGAAFRDEAIQVKREVL